MICDNLSRFSRVIQKLLVTSFEQNVSMSNFGALKIQKHFLSDKTRREKVIQARIVQLVAYRLGTGEVPYSNPGKGENFSMEISN